MAKETSLNRKETTKEGTWLGNKNTINKNTCKYNRLFFSWVCLTVETKFVTASNMVLM